MTPPEILLEGVTARLADREGDPDPQRVRVIAGYVRDAARQFAGAPVQVFVPLLVEHLVRDRISQRDPRPGEERLPA